MLETTVTFKQQVLEEAIKRQLSLIADFRERISDLMANDGNTNEEEYDLQSQAIMHENTSKVNLINNQLWFANEELQRLYKLQTNIHYRNETAQLGALVTTDRGIFFVSTSIEKFTVDGTPIFGLSTQSPLFQSMIGKNAGEEFEYKGTKYVIQSVQ